MDKILAILRKRIRYYGRETMKYHRKGSELSWDADKLYNSETGTFWEYMNFKVHMNKTALKYYNTYRELRRIYRITRGSLKEIGFCEVE